MDSLPCEILFYILEFVTSVKDVARCLQVCSQWYALMRDLNVKFAKEFLEGGYMRVVNLLLWSNMDFNEFLFVCKNKRIGDTTIRSNPECVYALRLLFADENVLATISKCRDRIEGELVKDLYVAWPFADSISVKDNGYIILRVDGGKIKVWLGNRPSIHFTTNYGSERSIYIDEKPPIGKLLAFRSMVNRRVEFKTFCSATNSVIAAYRPS